MFLIVLLTPFVTSTPLPDDVSSTSISIDSTLFDAQPLSVEDFITAKTRTDAEWKAIIEEKAQSYRASRSSERRDRLAVVPILGSTDESFDRTSTEIDDSVLSDYENHLLNEARTVGACQVPYDFVNRGGIIGTSWSWHDVPGLSVNSVNGALQIPISFDSNYDESERMWILRSLQHLGERIGCVEWVPRTDTTVMHYVYFVKEDPGCWAYATPETPTRVNLGSEGCLATRVIMHEMLHTLGMGHTHQRPDAYENVNINFTNAIPGVHAQLEPCSTCQLPDWPFDCDSVMMYSSDSFAKSSGGKVIEAINPTTCRLETIQQSADIYGYAFEDYVPLKYQVSDNDVISSQMLFCGLESPEGFDEFATMFDLNSSIHNQVGNLVLLLIASILFY